MDQSRLFAFLPKEEALRIKSRPGNRSESLVAYALLFMESDFHKVSRDSFGKPYFPDAPHVHFSISHTKDAIAVAVSSVPIGIDIENTKRSISTKVLERICDGQEFLRYKEASPKEQITLWTLKEAYGKYKGKGISLPLSSVSFPSLSECSDPSIYFRSKIHDDFVCSVCSERVEDWIPVSLSEILAKLPS